MSLFTVKEHIRPHVNPRKLSHRIVAIKRVMLDALNKGDTVMVTDELKVITVNDPMTALLSFSDGTSSFYEYVSTNTHTIAPPPQKASHEKAITKLPCSTTKKIILRKPRP